MTERTPFLKALVGSHNYNLQVPESDKDYKLFVLPTYDDMFTNRDFAKSYTPEDGDDLEYKDARHLTYLWWKSNVNFTEVLFSKELTAFEGMQPYVDRLLEKREDIARMNLPYLHRSSLGMVKTKLRTAERNFNANVPLLNGEEGTWTPWGKEMMTAYRLADFYTRYHANGFESFLDAIQYSDQEREFLLAFRNEEVKYQDAIKLVVEKEKKLLGLETNYSEEEGLKTKQFVDELLRELVKENLLHEFGGE